MHKSIHMLILLIGAGGFSLLVSCGGPSAAPSTEPAIIEETSGGEELLEREFGECDESVIPGNPLDYVHTLPAVRTSEAREQINVESLYPHEFRSRNRLFPLRGSWRQSKAEIMDIVNRMIWSPDQGKAVPLLDYFDMALLINVADRTRSTGSEKSAQRMQVFLRDGSSNELSQWNRAEIWPISSGRPCGKKIATPTGVFKFNPNRLYSDYSSQLFDGAEMFETMFLFHQYQNEALTGVAIHGTYKTERLGRRDSGGCVRLYRDNSQCLFNTITGRLSEPCLSGSRLDYFSEVISVYSKNGEADPEYLRSGALKVDGYRVLIAIFDDLEDEL
ncbi:MAG: L,D-transpeptidase [Pseudomonadota bacterium]